jgi:hypothetical protein
MIYLLVKLAAMNQQLPSSIYIYDVLCISGPFHGGFADIYKGIFQGTLVAIKQLRYNQDVPDTFVVCRGNYLYNLLY